MSKFILNACGTFIIGLVFGYACVFTFNQNKVDLEKSAHSKEISRETASVHEHGHSHDHGVIAKLDSHELLYNYVDVKIQLTDIAESDSGVSLVKAVLTAYKSMPSPFKYSWNLHQDMTSSSTLTGEIPALNEGETYEVTLAVVGFSKENRSYLSFGIDGNLEQNQIHKEFLATSRPEDSFEYVVQQRNLQERKEIERKTAGEASKMGGEETKTFLEKKFSKDRIIK